MHTQEGEARIGDRIDVPPDEIALLGAEDQIISPKGDDLRIARSARHLCQAVGVESPAGDHVFRLDLAAVTRLEDGPRAFAEHSRDFVVESDLGTHRPSIIGIREADEIPIDDPGHGGEDRGDPGTVRLALPDPTLIEHLQVLDTVLDTAFHEFVESLEFARFRRDDQLPDLTVFDPFLFAVPPDQFSPFDAKLGFQRTGLVVDPRMDDSAVVTRLVAGQRRFFFEIGDLERRVAEQELARRGESDDPAADDRYVVHHGLYLGGARRGLRSDGPLIRSAAPRSG